MRPDCPETDTLASVGEALGWSGAETIEHIAGCPSCRATLAGLAAVRASLRAVPEVDMARLRNPALPSVEPVPVVRREPARLALAVATFAVAGATALAALLLLGAGPGLVSSPQAVLFAAAVGVIVAAFPGRGAAQARG